MIGRETGGKKKVEERAKVGKDVLLQEGDTNAESLHTAFAQVKNTSR